jgi:hypothetical protein
MINDGGCPGKDVRMRRRWTTRTASRRSMAHRSNQRASIPVLETETADTTSEHLNHSIELNHLHRTFV